jgi:carbon monoxide dehydrogenase subunit G
MSLRIEQRCSVAAPTERIWKVLVDPYRVAGCLPGTAISEQLDHRTYRGTIAVKVGPITARYDGTIAFERTDREHWEVELIGRGVEVTGKGRAEVRLLSRLSPAEGKTELAIIAELTMSGILAQLGRGAVEMVAIRMFRQFAVDVERAASEVSSPQGGPAQ